MACSGSAVASGFFHCVLRKNKKGPKRPLHTARIWMALAIPGGAPGYDDDKQLGNFITHIPALTSQRLREHSVQTPDVKAERHEAQDSDFSGLYGVRRGRKCPLQPCRGLAWAHPLEFRQLVPEPGELPFGILAGRPAGNQPCPPPRDLSPPGPGHGGPARRPLPPPQRAQSSPPHRPPPPPR